MSADLKKVALDEVFLLGSLIKIGEVSALYAAPNVGKTLMTIALLIDSIRLGRINPALVYCVNADDNLNGLIQKLRIADEFDFHMLAEGHLDFKVTDLPDLMDEAIANDQARGVVMIIDTAKKVTNLMDKTRVSNFTALMRRFVGAGGTIVALAHINKKHGADNSPIYAGTSDVVDDADCAYTLDVLDSSDPVEKVVVFKNIKRRGNNAQTACYRYSGEPELSYEALLASVSPVDESQLQTIRREADLQSDTAAIKATITVIQEGIETKMKLADAVADRAGISKRAALKVIEKYTGTDPAKHRWSYEVRERGAKFYTLLPKSDD